MARYRSKLVQAAVALVLLITSAILWPSLSASATYASANYALTTTLTATAAACPTPGNNTCITSINSTPTVGVTLNGTDQILSFNLLFTLSNSVSGNWHVTIALTQFTTASVPQHTLPTASTITAVKVLSACTSTCPSNSIGYPVNVTAGNPPVTFYDNTPGGSNHGVGAFSILATLNVMVPGSTFAGNYTSTITITFVSGSP
jgi:hypothetical protein